MPLILVPFRADPKCFASEKEAVPLVPSMPTSFQTIVNGMVLKSMSCVATNCAYSYGLSLPLTLVSQPEMTMGDADHASAGAQSRRATGENQAFIGGEIFPHARCGKMRTAREHSRPGRQVEAGW